MNRLLPDLHVSRLKQAALDQPAEWNAWLRPMVDGRQKFRLLRPRRGGQPGRGDADVALVALDAEAARAKPDRHGAGGPGAEERNEDQVARRGGREDDTVKQASGFCVGCALRPSAWFRSSPVQM